MPEFDSTTEYRPIPDFPGYVAGTDGSIWTCKERGGPRQWRLGSRWVRMVPSLSKVGYQRVFLSNPDAKRRLFGVHRLILLAFVGPQPEAHVCRHLNSIRTDNRLENLQWSTQSENLSDRLANGTMIYGERCGKAKLTADDVRTIRRLASEGIKGSELGKQFGVHRNCIYSILGRTKRKTWLHI